MEETVQTNWLGKMVFESQVEEFSFQMDSDEIYGGTHQGPRPKPMMLGLLAGCTGMDIVSILQKKRIFPDRFRITATGDTREEHPKYYRTIRLLFEFEGKDFENNPEVLAKVERAIHLSLENYCAISAMIKNTVTVTREIVLRNSAS
ncbi:MAG TPA: OsmC family protein [Bacteroidales bacterium]|nr:OsmC family protein [Bacteroidales bacterium]